jgi:hypothetical protein
MGLFSHHHHHHEQPQGGPPPGNQGPHSHGGPGGPGGPVSRHLLPFVLESIATDKFYSTVAGKRIILREANSVRGRSLT